MSPNDAVPVQVSPKLRTQAIDWRPLTLIGVGALACLVWTAWLTRGAYGLLLLVIG